MISRRVLNQILTLTIFITVLPLLGITQIYLFRHWTSGQQKNSPEKYNLPPQKILRALSFGYNELAADLVWVRTISYFADHLLNDRDLRYLEKYLHNILALDPHFKEIYRMGAAMMMSRGQQNTNADAFAAISLLKRGFRLYPEQWEYPFNIGAYYINDLKTTSKEQKRAWRREGADWVRRAALIGSNISWLPTLAAGIYTEQGERDLAIKHLEEIYLTTPDEEMKKQIALKLKELKMTKYAEELKAATDEFNKRLEASPIKFVPADFFSLVDLPPLRSFDLASVLAKYEIKSATD